MDDMLRQAVTRLRVAPSSLLKHVSCLLTAHEDGLRVRLAAHE